ncbi:hypothetical protein HHI36_009314 [Cryptolaemus montrouzieri]|uniref:Uncharacterized protein n=1 Tax=Cryptolaemus montrouzieri TaxID=559131 RepID=A0ABD2MUV3_9CUCU
MQVNMVPNSSVSKLAETFEALYRARRQTLEDVLQKVRNAKDKINNIYSAREHETVNHPTLKAKKLKKRVTMQTRKKYSETSVNMPIATDYQEIDSGDFRYKVHNLVTYKESSLLIKFQKYK